MRKLDERIDFNMLLHKFHATLWKCLKIRQRHYMLTTFVLLIPILLYGLLAWGRTKIGHIDKHYVNESTYVLPRSEEKLFLDFGIDVEQTYLLYAPATVFTDELMLQVQYQLHVQNEKFLGFTTDDDLLEFYNKNITDKVVYAVIFDESTSNEIPTELKYSIRNYQKHGEWETDLLFNVISMQYLPDSGSAMYFQRAYINVQYAIEKIYLIMKNGENSLAVDFSMQEFPYPPHSDEIGFTEIFMMLLPLITLFSTIFTFPGTLKRMMEEKETGIKELMKMMGLPPSVMYFSWFIDALLPVLLSVFVCTILMKVPWGTAYPPLEATNWIIYAVFLLLYFSSCIAFCLFVGTLNNSPSITTTLSILVWIITYIIPFSVHNLANLGFALNMLLCLIPNFAMFHGFNAIKLYEIQGDGVQWHNLYESANGGMSAVPMGYALLMLFVDIVLLLLLGYYFDQILPGKYGLPKKWNYPFVNMLNCIGIKQKHKRRNSSVEPMNDTTNLDNIEECTLLPGITINNLTKDYDGKLAVDNMSVKFFQGEIAVLLGRNGAGKTTTMSVLTGMTKATRGEVLIDGYDIRDNLSHVRSIMGICPQHDLLFPELTVFEHVMFFAKLNNVSNAEARVLQLLEELGISEQRGKFAREISGGMKRKLCLGMALISNPHVLIMDEPTSGLDPKSRRDIWDLILKWRTTNRNATIMVSTHFMEEADVLGDRITIIESGKLVAQGAPMYLKQRFGNQCTVTLILKPNAEVQKLQDVFDWFAAKYDDAAKLTKKDDSYEIQLTNDGKQHLVKLFDELARYDMVERVGVSVTTIEDVFIRLANVLEKPPADYDHTDNISEDRPSSPGRKSRLILMGVLQATILTVIDWMHRYGGIIYHYKRFLPYLLMACAMMLLLVNVGSTQSVERSLRPELKFDLSVYGNTMVYYSIDSRITDKSLAQEFHKQVIAQNSNPILVDSVSNALIDLGIHDFKDYKQKAVVALEFNHTANGRVLINMMYSNPALHGAPIILNLAMSVVGKAQLGLEPIRASNIPLKTNEDIAIEELASEIEIVLLWVILAPIGLLFIVSSFLDSPLRERVSNFKHLIYMSGLYPVQYWMSLFCFNFFVLYLPATGILYLIVRFTSLYSAGAFPVWILLVCYGIMMIPCVFIFSYKKSVASAVGALSVLTILTGLVFPLVIQIMKNCGEKFYERLGSVLHWMSHISPQYWLTNNLITFSRKSVWEYKWDTMTPQQQVLTCKFNLNPCCPVNGVVDKTACSEYRSFFTDGMAPIPLILVTCIVFAAYIVLLCIFDSIICKRFWNKLQRIIFRMGRPGRSDEMDDQTSLFAAKNLRKSFAGKQDAVRDLSFHVNPGQCYGLLGVNGAGKTTTFKMLTGHEIPTSGYASIKNKRLDAWWDMDEYFKQIGYCPQFNAINEVLSARTLLRIFASLRGMPRKNIDNEVQHMITRLTLHEFADLECGNLSGGNKRKLCLGISLIGKPSIGFLDEPTTGVDPVSRRKIWNVLSSVKKNDQQPLVLTSHSMDECEILCDYLAIMKKGEVTIKGNINDLKTSYGEGLTIKIKLVHNKKDHSSDAVDGPTGNATLNFPQIVREKINDPNIKVDLKDQHEGLLHYFISKQNCGVNDLRQFLEIMENLKRENENVEDYTINTSTLEDIFLAVARQSEAELQSSGDGSRIV